METQEFKQLINSDKPVLVDFFATWCGPCQYMTPILEEVKSKVNGKAEVIKVDVDKSPQIAAEYGIRGVPTLILLKNGESKWRQSGVVPASELVRVIEEEV